MPSLTLRGILVALLLVLGLPSAAPAEPAWETGTLPLVARTLDGVHQDRVVIQFINDSGVRLRDGGLRVEAAARDPRPRGTSPGSAAQAILDPAVVERDLARIADLLRAHPGSRIERRIQLPEETVAAVRARGQAVRGRVLDDLNLFFVLHLPPAGDGPAGRARLERVLLELNALPSVVAAFADPVMEVATLGEAAIRGAERRLEAPRTTTPDFSPQQGYLYDAPTGVEAPAAWGFPGGRGQGVRVVDIEFGWRFTHEDFRAPFFIGGEPGDDDHGTAVLGEISGLDNGFGVTGIAPDVEIGGASVNSMSLAEAILLLTTVLAPGDIYVIELHAVGPYGRWLPMEFWGDNFAAIQTAAELGIIGCEAAGNGSENLDFVGYEGAFDRRLRDSGAIMCGAGTPQGLDGEWFTNYGSRVDLQGWGSSVVTTGYGDLWNTGPDSMYTAGFNGTSSATPIVTGSVVSLQGQALALFGEPLTAWLAAEILSRTGSPWTGPKAIGERPNLEAARALLETGYATVDVIVRDAATLLPLPGMVVEVLETGRLGIADENGGMTFQMSAGSYTLHTESFFYTPTDLALTVAAGAPQQVFFDIAALPMGELAGTVFDEGLNRLAGARVASLVAPLGTVYADPDGRYAFVGIPEREGYEFIAGGIPALGCAYRRCAIRGGETERWFPVLVPAQDFEAGNGGYTPQGNWEWGRPMGQGPGGAFSGQKCWATRLVGYYQTYQWINLTSPVYDFSEADVLHLSFHHWYWIHAFDDGGNVQVYSDGAWQIVTPAGGYDAQSIPTLGPGFTGDSDGWRDEFFDLTAYKSASTQIRFRFVSDNAGVGPGWYIDDVAFDTGGGSQAVEGLSGEGAASALRLLLAAPAPNPATRETRIAFRLPAAQRITLAVHDVQGRVLRVLQSGPIEAGEHVAVWDGCADDGAPAPAGLYFVRLQAADGRIATRPLVRLP